MSVIKVEMSYDSASNVYTIKGLKKNPPAEVLVHILDTIKNEVEPSQLFDLTIKLVEKNSVETMSIQDFIKRVEKDLKENEKETKTDQPTPSCVIRITFYLSNGSMLQAECDLETAHDVMDAYEKPETRPVEHALFQDIHDRHYAIPYTNIVAAYCDFIEGGSELHDIK